MRRLISFVLCLVTVFSLANVCYATSYEEDSDGNTSIPMTDAHNGKAEIQPRTSYDHPIPDFKLVAGERAFTTRWGYGFTISNDGLDHDDIDLTFSVNGEAVNLEIAVMTMESYSNGYYDTTVKSETITSAGSKTISFNNLAYGTYVVKWQNIGEKEISVTNARLKTSY